MSDVNFSSATANQDIARAAAPQAGASISTPTTLTNSAFGTTITVTEAVIVTLPSVAGNATKRIYATMVHTSGFVRFSPVGGAKIDGLRKDREYGPGAYATFYCDGIGWFTAEVPGDAVTPVSPFPGKNYGFVFCGEPPQQNTVKRFSLTVDDATAAPWTTLTAARNAPGPVSSDDYGFAGGGWGPSAVSAVIDRFHFITTAAGTSWGALTVTRNNCTGHSSREDGRGWVAGGHNGAFQSVIDSFLTATSSSTTVWGYLTVGKLDSAGHNSFDYGFVSGGSTGTFTTKIERFQFATTSSGADWDVLSVATNGSIGHSSAEYGYSSGGDDGSLTDIVRRFSFTTQSGTTNWATLSAAKNQGAGVSAEDYAHTGGGYSGSNTNVLEKFSIATGGTSTAYGSIGTAFVRIAGAQY